MKYVLEVNNLTKSYGKYKILDDVSFKIQAGEVVGFVGPNGAGKTTTIKCCVGLVKKYTGSIKIVDCDVKKNFEQAIKKVLFMLDVSGFYDHLTAFENLALYYPLYEKPQKEKIISVLSKVGLTERKDDKVQTYSLGMRQRLSLARCLMYSPNIILMDEPLNGLDPTGVNDFRDYVKKVAAANNIAILISSHNLVELTKICSRILTISKGRMLGELNLKDEQEILITLNLFNSSADFLKKLESKFSTSVDRELDNNFSFTINKAKVDELIKFIHQEGQKISHFTTSSALEKKYLNLFGGNKIA